MRPIEYFLSHRAADRAAVMELETAMRLRGLASWRDRRSLVAGDDNDVAIHAGVEMETSGFVIYGSRNITDSKYVWDKEWKWAHERRERERAIGHPAPYRVAPLLVDGLDHAKLTDAAARWERPDPMTANAEHLRGDDPADRDRVARWLLHGALRDRTRLHSSPLRIRLTTFRGAQDTESDLVVDWSLEFEAETVAWTALRSAVQDLKHEVASLGRPIEIDAQARLAPAFVFGHAFPLVSRIDLAAIHRDGSRWILGRRADSSLIRLETTVTDTGDPAVAAVEVSLARDVTAAAAAAVQALEKRPGRRATLGFAQGIDEVDRRVAEAASFGFGDLIRRLRDDGVRETHVFIAAPAALVVLLGAAVNAGPAMTLYHMEGGAYRPSLALSA